MRIGARVLRCGMLAGALTGVAGAQAAAGPKMEFKPVPELPYRAAGEFFHFPAGYVAGEVAAVAVNSKGHVFVFQRGKPSLMEFDDRGGYVRSLGEGLFTTAHGLRVDPEDNLWTTDTGSHVVLKLSPEGRVLLVLGRKGQAAEGDWIFNRPADVAFGANGDIFVADGYGNSRIVRFDRTGKFLKAWGTFGTAPGQFDLPHSVVIDRTGKVYVADRENARVQVFDEDGKFLKQWAGIGYPYGLALGPDGNVWMSDGGFDRVVEFTPDGQVIGAMGEPGHGPGQMAWAHFLAVGPNRAVYVADVLNWRVDVFEPTGSGPTGKMTSYVPTKRMFDATTPSNGYITRQPK